MTQPGNQPDASSDRQPRNQQACGTRSRHAWQRVPAGSLHRRAQAMSGAPERLVAFVDGIGMTSPETLNAASPRQEVGGAGARVPANSAVSSRDCRLPNRHRLRMSGPVKVADTPRAVKVHRWPDSGQLIEFRTEQLEQTAIERVARRLSVLPTVSKVAFRTGGGVGGWLVGHHATAIECAGLFQRPTRGGLALFAIVLGGSFHGHR